MEGATRMPVGGAGTNKGLDLNRSAVPRHIQLTTLFRHRIEQGAWKTGQQIPTVDQLAAECGVARATIRQAMDQLEAEGLIERFRADRKSTRLNSSHANISYAVFCLK